LGKHAVTELQAGKCRSGQNGVLPTIIQDSAIRDVILERLSRDASERQIDDVRDNYNITHTTSSVESARGICKDHRRTPKQMHQSHLLCNRRGSMTLVEMNTASEQRNTRGSTLQKA
jgi:hypothetical protein